MSLRAEHRRVEAGTAEQDGDAALPERLYDGLVDQDQRGSASEEVRRHAPANAVRIVGSLTLQKVGDRLADPKTVLTWLLSTLAAPLALTGLLVPVREAGSAGARLGRKASVTDMATGNRRSEYVAAANRAMGLLLLGAGGLTSSLALLGAEAALIAPALGGTAGVAVSVGLPEVSAAHAGDR